MANGAILGQSTTTWTNNQILSSVSAALYSLGANATPDQVFAAIRPLITTAQSTATNAQSTATTAQSTATTAQSTATSAQQVATAAQQTANNASVAAGNAQSTANNALNIANGKATVVTGSYVGDGNANKTINLGITPNLVIITCYGNFYGIGVNYGWMAGINLPANTAISESSGRTIVQIVSNGFTIYNFNNVYTNTPGKQYYFIAFIT